ncbi:hypothetical protein GCM10008995_17080 [Halobellus salinus]|uniref:Uncharacterized protein n=1 Tax=Halobellus salinus TaxID=931585 RepID=A0A830EIB4_9EURY|nr:hypothetical protein [Halobellus salinus]GGJ07748.1 hypothetical protein GCM10008995_17080 [Halobellus salinus]SMP26497.1 hypothetical protein SAMN06265347_11198 [Halobellus salinus]
MSDDTTSTHPDSDGPDDRTVIRSCREFEREYRLSADGAGQVLTESGEQPRNSDGLRRQLRARHPTDAARTPVSTR